MKKPFLYTLLALAMAGSVVTAEAKPDRDRHGRRDRDRDDRHEHGDRRDRDRHYGRHDRHDHYGRYNRDRYSRSSRTIYVIHNGRPVRRVAYLDPAGYYYRIVSGRRVRVRERYYTSYPSRYYYPDGRRRIGITLSL
jgi:hypothetical protein